MTNKKKIINDPVYGFISITHDSCFDIIQHPYFQRLRQIKQLGLTSMVYPGANHSRFQHAVGAMHLMHLAINTLRYKNVSITNDEEEEAKIAILLHDIGHGPFSHALENSLVSNISHETLSAYFMESLNQQFSGKLSMALDIFNDNYPKKFLHQLVSSQLDVDRLDYLKRDTFFTGVTEGAISYERIIKMLKINAGELAVELKGIYSIEKFLIARRLMYWQVYLHKTVVAAEQLLMNILKRAKELASQETLLFASPFLSYFLYRDISDKSITSAKIKAEVLYNFSNLDDSDIHSAIKVWAKNDDFILSTLCQWLLNRSLYKIQIQNKPFKKEDIIAIKTKTQEVLNISDQDLEYFVFTKELSNKTYSPFSEKITIVNNQGVACDISEASDLINLSILSQSIKKYYLCYPK